MEVILRSGAQEFRLPRAVFVDLLRMAYKEGWTSPLRHTATGAPVLPVGGFLLFKRTTKALGNHLLAVSLKRPRWLHGLTENFAGEAHRLAVFLLAVEEPVRVETVSA